MINVPIEVKDALRDGTYRKNYRMIVLNDDESEDFTIDNNNLVKESVNIDERMCSGDIIKFGLCEGSSLEFQYFLIDKGQYEANETYMRNDLVHSADTVWRSKTNDNIGNPLQEGQYWAEWEKPNITDRQVQVFCDVEYGANQPYTIPMGFFTVKNCSRQASTGIIKVTAYNKLMSDYLDANVNEEFLELVNEGEYGEDERSIHTILSALLEDYSIDLRRPQLSVPTFSEEITGGRIYDYPICDANGNLTGNHVWVHYCRPFIQLDENDFYYFTLNTINMLDYARESVWERYKNTYVTIAGTPWVLTLNEMAQHDGIVSSGRLDARGALSGYLFIGRDFVSTLTKKTFAQEFGGQADKYTDELSRCTQALFMCPLSIDIRDRAATSGDILDLNTCLRLFNRIWVGFHPLIMAKRDLSEMEKMRLTTDMVQGINDVTLRELQAATYETACQFGQLDRETDLFSGVELNHSRLLPADTLYPDSALYPGGGATSGFKSTYSKLWADEGNVHKWKYLIITYKGLDQEGNEIERTLQRTVNADGTDNYNCSDNWLFRNLVWTAEQIGEYADAMVAKMRDITWFPFEMWCAGLPYIETGDEIEIPLGEQTYTSYILQRQLKGIQNLQDTYINGTLDIF